jgi:hypothetical protein
VSEAKIVENLRDDASRRRVAAGSEIAARLEIAASHSRLLRASVLGSRSRSGTFRGTSVEIQTMPIILER